MSWLDTALAAYAVVQIAGVPVQQRRTMNFVSGVTAADDPVNLRTNLTVSGGGGGGSGPTVNGTASMSTSLTRSASWIVQPVDSGSSPVTITAWATPTLGDIIMVPDANGSYATNSMTFNGNGTSVENPYDSAMAPTSTCVVSFAGAKPGWICIANAIGTKVWRSFMSC